MTTAVLPAWWETVLCRRLGLASLGPESLRPFVAPLARLSSMLNDVEEREGVPSTYMRDSRGRLSYQLYYATANLLKPLWALQQLWPDGPPAGGAPLRVLDLGCGPGTGIAALHAWFDRNGSGRALSVTGVDASEAAADEYRRMGADIAAVTGHPIDCDARAGDASRGGGAEGEQDLIMALNLINELPVSRRDAFLAQCRDLLVPGGMLLLIEPALRLTSRVLLQLRDRAVREGWTVLLPCFRQGECPALANEKDWCHHDLPWERPAHIAWLDEEIGNIKRSLKFSCIVLQRPLGHPGGDAPAPAAPVQDSGMQRVVSELFVEKGRSWCYCCGAEGRRVYQRNHRDRSEENAAFDGLRRYDAVRFDGVEVRAHDVRVTAGTRVRKLG